MDDVLEQVEQVLISSLITDRFASDHLDFSTWDMISRHTVLDVCPPHRVLLRPCNPDQCGGWNRHFQQLIEHHD